MYRIGLLAQQAPDGGLGAIVGAYMLVMVVAFILAVAATIFWIWMLVDVLASRRETNEKILWFLVIFLLHIIGALIYFFVERGKSGSVAAGHAA
jgi:hypothetical protein